MNDKKATWTEAKDACNRLRAEFFGGDVYDWVASCGNGLPSCAKGILLHAFVYDVVNDDVDIVKEVYKMMIELEDFDI